MSKISERLILDGQKAIVQETHDFNPILSHANQLRAAGRENFGESKLVGVVPMKLWAEWAKDAGLKLDDPAMGDVIARKMNDPDFAHLRVWKGRY